MEDVPIEETGRCRLACRLSRLLEIERSNLLVGARNDGEAGRACFVERDATNCEEGGTERHTRGIFSLPLRLSYTRRDFFFVNDITVPQAF